MKFILSVYLAADVPTINYALEKTTYVLGRHSSCDILILDQFLSRYHCTLILMEPSGTCNQLHYIIYDGLSLSQERSRNGVWVNGERIKILQNLNHQDVITFGSCSYPKAIFTIDVDKDEGTVPSEFEN
ncbi:MAG: FHA domain-containing protein [Nostoc sp.]|uniref:FHA domain-containing protein n=1 Tax=Nostoc sp. TaxID=1180 RepID=UPI002FEF95FB